ncbi:MAG: S-adenosylmethionine:tRNA ribosyltransferase-isomerase [Proteobacteria bacterium SG_bin7]|nr:MAG: S-adenosylmethionine:tRNA ribosyltransferase-isomerase [Proteobacteria bacterium SG_bin7]
MDLRDLDFKYPETLVATEPSDFSRVMWVDSHGIPSEVSIDELLGKFSGGDVLILNNSRVLKRRIFSQEGFEILFIKELKENNWEVLFPATRMKSAKLLLPEQVELKFVKGGRPQVVEVNKNLDDNYFEKYGELPLPPYIQKARQERHQKSEDEKWYQTAWAKEPGSLASPTASLHFKNHHLEILKKKSVKIVYVTLHVGLGTFLPISAVNLKDHKMHEEEFEVTKEAWNEIQSAKTNGKNIWALGTTSVRAVESFAYKQIEKSTTDLFIIPGFEFKVVTRLLTNFHQPQTTLLALVSAFSNGRWQKCYEWAIENKFRLFSYGDLTAWEN